MAISKNLLEKFDIEEASKMMRSGKSQKEIGEKFGIAAQRVSECFKAHGVKFIKRSFYIDDFFFDTIDSEKKAYILGFLIADGCIREEKRKTTTSYRIAFNNSIDDEDVIKLIHESICPEAKLVYHNASTAKVTRKTGITLQWTSEDMAKTLMSKYNIFPHKTTDTEFELPENSIPESLWRHVIRGFFDGDGHYGKSQIEFIFTSKKFMNQILKFFSQFKYRIVECEGKSVIYYKLIITGGTKLITYTKTLFYQDSNYYLKRKYAQFNSELTEEIAQGSEVM